MRIAIAVMFSVLVASPSLAQQMNAETFYQRAMKLQKKGPLALFSRGEIKALMAEGQAAGKAARLARLEAAKSGRKPRYCPPAGPQSMNSDEFMQRLGAIPQAERARIDMTEATTRIMTVKFPCRAA